MTTPSLPASTGPRSLTDPLLHGEVAGLVEEREIAKLAAWLRDYDAGDRVAHDQFDRAADLLESLTAQPDQNGVLQDDLGELLRLLGMPGHARPQSPHDVFQEALAELRRRLTPSPVEARADGVREALQRWRDGYAFNEDCEEDLELAERADRELAALESTPAQPVREGQEGKAEPVAWRFKHKHVVNDRWRFNDKPPEGEPWTCGEPLYASQPDPAAEIAEHRRENERLRATMRLHAGDTISLDNDARTANEEAARWMDEALADRARAERAESELAVIREALEPFKRLGELLELETEGFVDSDVLNVTPKIAPDTIIGDLTFGHFRALATADRGQEEKGK